MFRYGAAGRQARSFVPSPKRPGNLGNDLSARIPTLWKQQVHAGAFPFLKPCKNHGQLFTCLAPCASKPYLLNHAALTRPKPTKKTYGTHYQGACCASIEPEGGAPGVAWPSLLALKETIFLETRCSFLLACSYVCIVKYVCRLKRHEAASIKCLPNMQDLAWTLGQKPHLLLWGQLVLVCIPYSSILQRTCMILLQNEKEGVASVAI